MKKIENMSIMEKIQFVCVFLPILCTLAYIIYEIAGADRSQILIMITEIMLVVGLISAAVCIILTNLIGFLKFLLSFLVKGWTLGMAIVPIFPINFFAGVIGGAIACVLLMALCVYIPVAITVYFYFFNKVE